MPIFADIYLEPGGIIAWLLVGLIAGFLAGKVMKGSGYGILGDLIVGLIGAFLGGLLFGSFAHGEYALIRQHHRRFRRSLHPHRRRAVRRPRRIGPVTSRPCFRARVTHGNRDRGHLPHDFNSSDRQVEDVKVGVHEGEFLVFNNMPGQSPAGVHPSEHLYSFLIRCQTLCVRSLPSPAVKSVGRSFPGAAKQNVTLSPSRS